MRDFEKKIGLSLPLRHLFPFSTHSSKRKKVCVERVKKKMSERTVEVRSRLRSSRRDRRALFIQDNDRANRLMGNGLIFIIFQKNTFIHKIRR